MTEICIKDRLLDIFSMLVSTDITDHQQFATEEIYLHFIFKPLCEYISLYINLSLYLNFPQYVNISPTSASFHFSILGGHI